MHDQAFYKQRDRIRKKYNDSMKVEKVKHCKLGMSIIHQIFCADSDSCEKFAIRKSNLIRGLQIFGFFANFIVLYL